MKDAGAYGNAREYIAIVANGTIDGARQAREAPYSALRDVE